MSTNTSTTTLYIDPPFSNHLRKLDNRVEQVELYGAKEAKKMNLSDVISDDGILRSFSKVPSTIKSEKVVENGGVDPTTVS